MTVEVCIIGLGPAGLGAALGLLRRGRAAGVICVEAGPRAEERFCTIVQQRGCRFAQPCHIVGGVGGCGVMSGGKISDYPAGRGMSPLLRQSRGLPDLLGTALIELTNYLPIALAATDATALQEAKSFFAQRGFDFRYYPAHRYKQEDYVQGCARLVRELETGGAKVLSNTQVTGIYRGRSRWRIRMEGPQGSGALIKARVVIFAGGRLGVDLLSSVAASEGISRKAIEPDVGVRLEFPSDAWSDISRWHNDLKLHFSPNARTFCVCDGGILTPYRWKESFWMEGSSASPSVHPYTNFGVSVRLPPHTPAEVEQLGDEIAARTKAISGGRPVRQQLSAVTSTRASTPLFRGGASFRYWSWGQVLDCFPDSARVQLAAAVRKISGLFQEEDWPAVSVFAPEADYLWPKIDLRRGFLTGASNFHVVGDAGGHFRGILQAFASGLHCAEELP